MRVAYDTKAKQLYLNTTLARKQTKQLNLILSYDYDWLPSCSGMPASRAPFLLN